MGGSTTSMAYAGCLVSAAGVAIEPPDGGIWRRTHPSRGGLRTNWHFLLTQVRSRSEAVRLTAHGLGSAPSLRSKNAKTLGRRSGRAEAEGSQRPVRRGRRPITCGYAPSAFVTAKKVSPSVVAKAHEAKGSS